jgi:hypothetical protein
MPLKKRRAQVTLHPSSKLRSKSAAVCLVSRDEDGKRCREGSDMDGKWGGAGKKTMMSSCKAREPTDVSECAAAAHAVVERVFFDHQHQLTIHQTPSPAASPLKVCAFFTHACLENGQMLRGGMTNRQPRTCDGNKVSFFSYSFQKHPPRRVFRLFHPLFLFLRFNGPRASMSLYFRASNCNIHFCSLSLPTFGPREQKPRGASIYIRRCHIHGA